jgi:succinoglycan biosynthesis protein ExoA
MLSTTNETRMPFVTIIMPVRNEGNFIRRSLGAVLAQDYPPNRLEVLVADGRSTDNTREIVRDLKNGHPNLHLVDNPGCIVPTGLNLALGRAHGEFIVRVDGHTLIAPDYVSQCVATLQRSRADNAGGKMDASSSTPFGAAVAIATSSPFGVGNGRFHYSDREEWVDTVYMGAWPRRVFHDIGLFDEEMVRNQDDEFNYRLCERGGKILLSPKIKSRYTNRSRPRALWRQYSQYGYWKVRVLQKHPLQMCARQFAPPILVLALLASLILALFHTAFPFPVPAALFHLHPLAPVVPGLYLLANLCASLYTAAKRGWRYLLMLPLVYAILHLSYGLGFLAGLLKFWDRWGDKAGRVPDWHTRPVRPLES